MIPHSYLRLGLTGMARAHRANALAGHLGAAVIAGVFFSEDHPDLPEEVVDAVRGELDKITSGGEGIWFDAKKAGITVPELFEPFADEPGRETAIPDVALELSEDINALRESGHDVIFAALSLRALHDHPEYATTAIVGGLRKLMSGFHQKSGGRGFYGKTGGGWKQAEQVALPDSTEFPTYRDEDEMAEVTINELIASASLHRQGFGGLFHVINHAAALTDLARMGYRGLARQGLAAHHHHVRLWRSLPDLTGEFGRLVKARHDPKSPDYWKERDSGQWSAQLTHRIKTLYGFNTLMKQVEDEGKRKQAREAFLYLMG